LRSRLCATAEQFPTLVIATPAAEESRAAALAARGVEIARVDPEASGRVDLREALRLLARRGATRVFSEGGPRVGARLIALGLADEVALLTAAKPLGRPGLPALDAAAYATLADKRRYREIDTAVYGADTLRRWERAAFAG
ncbi:MAG TPA: dihydrofolate reductase family protein, partial [Roseiarcus sp.]|nr:dihydrofolate reductase family protein [Roseiarcus sp.]